VYASSFHPSANKGIIVIENRGYAVDIWKKGVFDMPHVVFDLVHQERYLYSGEPESFPNGESAAFSQGTLD